MHNRFWLSVLLALFLAVSACTKHDETSSESGSAADSMSPATQPAVPAATGAVQDKPAQAPDVLMENSSAAPEKTDASNRSDMAEPEAKKQKALRKKESGATEDNKAKPAGDDMGRMD